MEAVIFFSIMFGGLLVIGLGVAYYVNKKEEVKSVKIRSEFLKQYE
jgi:hypothetical protein